MKVIETNEYKVSNWSGGETKEIYLSPVQRGMYKVGKFDFRLSSATIELEETTFTSLPGYKRLIMSLDKPLKLYHKHNQRYEEIALTPLEPHYFLGEDQTVAVGKCTDFNLIFKSNFTGEMGIFGDRESLAISFEKVYLIYALEDLVLNLVDKNNEVQVKCRLNAGNSVVFEELSESHTLVLEIKTGTKKAIAVVTSVVEN